MVTINDSDSLHLGSGMTLEAWVSLSTLSNAWRDVIYKGDDDYFLEGTSMTNEVPGGGGTFATTDEVIYASSDLSANTWGHLALTYDGSNLAALCKRSTSLEPFKLLEVSCHPVIIRYRSAETASGASISAALSTKCAFTMLPLPPRKFRQT